MGLLVPPVLVGLFQAFSETSDSLAPHVHAEIPAQGAHLGRWKG